MDITSFPRHPQGHERPRAADQRVRPLRAGRRARQPRDQPHGAVPQPGDAGAGGVLAAHVPPLVGADADPGQPARRRRRCSTSRRSSASRRSCCGCRYDVVGISAIPPNIGKVKRMCELVRRHQPGATIVVGGHIANRAGLAEQIDADHVVRGEGVAWFRAFLGEDGGRAGPPPAGAVDLRGAHDGRAVRHRSGRDGGDASSPRSAARSAATSARPRPCSAARAASSASTRTATSCSR